MNTADSGVFLSSNLGAFNINGGTLQTLTTDGVTLFDEQGVVSILGLTVDNAAANGLRVDNHTAIATLNVNNSVFSNSATGVLLDVSSGGTLILSGAGNTLTGNAVNCVSNQGAGAFNGFLDFGAAGTCP